LHLRFSFCRDKSSRRAREEETFSTGQKVITLPQGWHGFFFISFSFLLTIFVYGKKKSQALELQVICVGLISSGSGTIARRLGWTGLD
jgi:glycerol uptake facilitator-like aquaporin